MKKRLCAGLLLLAAVLGLSGCGVDNLPSPHEDVNNLEGVWMEIQEDSITPCGLTLDFMNGTGETPCPYFYGAWFRLEERRRGKWYQVEPEADYWAQDDWAMHPPSQMTCDWTWYYGELPKGELPHCGGAALRFRRARPARFSPVLSGGGVFR